MPIAVIIQLLTTFGPGAINLVDTLITKWSTNTAVTPDEWAALKVALTQTAADRLKGQLAAAGIDPASPQGVALLALVK